MSMKEEYMKDFDIYHAKADECERKAFYILIAIYIIPVLSFCFYASDYMDPGYELTGVISLFFLLTGGFNSLKENLKRSLLNRTGLKSPDPYDYQ